MSISKLTDMYVFIDLALILIDDLSKILVPKISLAPGDLDLNIGAFEFLDNRSPRSKRVLWTRGQ